MKNYIFKKIWKWIKQKLATMDWQEVLYNFYSKTIRPTLLKLVESTETKFDDIMFTGIDKIIETYLKPHKKQGQEIPYKPEDC